MGTVYLAHQKTEIFDRTVAVKVLSWRPLGDDARRRFRVEQQAMGRVDHPAVARIYDSGITADGGPYLVLEHVPGEPIDRWCDRRGLGLPERIALLRRVCEGVSASHQRLIVHADLKPGNVLVREDGQPKLLDFGISRLLDSAAESAEGSRPPRMRALTPQYASPEQVSGEPVTTASDVFSLGVVLYKVLTGTLPWSVAEAASGRRTSPIAPSDRESRGRRWARRLRGDLDSIVLKALEADPARRYLSVESLRQDLGRFLQDQPVEARPAGRVSRIGKYLRRNRWAGYGGGRRRSGDLGPGGQPLDRSPACRSHAQAGTRDLGVSQRSLRASRSPGRRKARDHSERGLRNHGE